MLNQLVNFKPPHSFDTAIFQSWVIKKKIETSQTRYIIIRDKLETSNLNYLYKNGFRIWYAMLCFDDRIEHFSIISWCNPDEIDKLIKDKLNVANKQSSFVCELIIKPDGNISHMPRLFEDGIKELTESDKDKVFDNIFSTIH